MSSSRSSSSSSSSRQVKVAVVGGGIVGISSALRILQSVPDAAVTIFTDRLSPHTTGDVAAGFWTPIYLSDTDADVSDRWSEITYKMLQSVIESDPQPSRTGVLYCPGYAVYRSNAPPHITWSYVPLGFRRASDSELRMFSSEYRSGYFYVTIMAEGRKFIPYLLDRFFKLGGKLVANHRVGDFKEISALGFDRIVNCTGMGARQLCGDEKVVPIRGQVLRAVAPWMNFFVVDDEECTYCLPNSDTVVLGGCSQRGNYSLEVSQQDRSSIVEKVQRLWPSLRDAKIVGEAVGLRPGRNKVRVERQRAGECTIYHNYGHGGSGLTIFWGCAGDVVQMLMEDLLTHAKL